MNMAYTAGYADGRYNVLQDLRRELRDRSEPLHQPILSDSLALSKKKFIAGQLDVLMELQGWTSKEMERTK